MSRHDDEDRAIGVRKEGVLPGAARNLLEAAQVRGVPGRRRVHRDSVKGIEVALHPRSADPTRWHLHRCVAEALARIGRRDQRQAGQRIARQGLSLTGRIRDGENHHRERQNRCSHEASPIGRSSS